MKKLKCRAIPIESCKVNGQYTRYWILVKSKDSGETNAMELMPKTDKEDVDLEVFVPYRIPSLPKVDLTDEQRISSIFAHLHRGFRTALDIRGHRGSDPKVLRSKMMTYLMDVYRYQKLVRTAPALKFIAAAASHLDKRFKEPKDESVKEESWDEWKAKIHARVQDNVDHLRMPPLTTEGNPVLRATRFDVPKPLRKIAAAMFVADLPRVRNWPDDAGDAPHIIVDIPHMKKGNDLTSTADTAERRQQSLGKGQKTPDVFKIIIDRPYSDTTINMELRATSKLTVPNEDHSTWAHFSRYLLGFDGPVFHHRVMKIFPILKAISDKAKKHKE
ncbi:hypothetical protein PG997_011716 [Apiospora hydei]|uniref:Uncharacterized protein n=1 Tax=Apiospora hydei TaxID=1337664 RepID=A0ABR1V4H3_9PEZI